MTFTDIFKSSFLEKASEFSVLDVSFAMLIAFSIALYIFFIYKKTFSGVMYSSAFGVSIMAMTLITALIILAVTSNVILSLGMVGALSIVRFRTAVKEPLDIAFLFWSISVGIVVGAGLIPLAVIGSLFIGIVLLIFVNHKNDETPYILIFKADNDFIEQEAMKVISSESKKHLVKSKIIFKEGIEITVEVRLKNNSTDMMNQIIKLDGIENATLVSYNGEYSI